MGKLGEWFRRRKDEPKGEDTGLSAKTIWDRIGGMAVDGKPTKFSVDKKISPEQLPDGDLKTWDYLRSLPDSFKVEIVSNIGRLITITSGTRYRKLSVRGPNVTPVYEEGAVEGDREVLLTTEPLKDSLDFADKFTRFIFHQREHSQNNS